MEVREVASRRLVAHPPSTPRNVTRGTVGVKTARAGALARRQGVVVGSRAKERGNVMRVVQADIAAKVGLDVSSVNKILNEKVGPVFRESTIRRVKATAKRMGWTPRKTDLRHLKTVVRKIRDVYFVNASPSAKLERIRQLLGNVG